MKLIERKDNLWIEVRDKDGGFIQEQSVQSILLYEILKELRKLNRR